MNQLEHATSLKSVITDRFRIVLTEVGSIIIMSSWFNHVRPRWHRRCERYLLEAWSRYWTPDVLAHIYLSNAIIMHPRRMHTTRGQRPCCVVLPERANCDRSWHAYESYWRPPAGQVRSPQKPCMTHLVRRGRRRHTHTRRRETASSALGTRIQIRKLNRRRRRRRDCCHHALTTYVLNYS